MNKISWSIICLKRNKFHIRSYGHNPLIPIQSVQKFQFTILTIYFSMNFLRLTLHCMKYNYIIRSARRIMFYGLYILYVLLSKFRILKLLEQDCFGAKSAISWRYHIFQKNNSVEYIVSVSTWLLKLWTKIQVRLGEIFSVLLTEWVNCKPDFLNNYHYMQMFCLDAFYYC